MSLVKPVSARLKKRLISALVVAPVVIWAILKGGVPFMILVVACAAICFFEWVQLSLRSKNKAALVVAGVLYIALAFWSCYLIRTDHSVRVALLFIVMIWASDVGAYITGKLVGGPKMAPSISPNKTWAGYVGAAFFPGIAGGIFMLVYEFFYGAPLTPGMAFTYGIAMLVIGMVIGGVGQAGDLLVSWLKRAVGVKDTGDLIPGHGGLLDRVDALMLAAPVFLFFVTKFPYVFDS